MSNLFSQFKSTVLQSFFYSVGNIFAKLSGIILLPLYLIYLPVDEFGLFALFEALFQIFQVFTGMGVKLGLSRWYWDEKYVSKQKSLFFTTYIFNALVCVLFTVLLYFGFHILSHYYFKLTISGNAYILFLIGNLIKLFGEVPLLLLRIQEKAKKHSIIQIIQLCVFVIAAYILMAFFNLKLSGLFIATIISAFIQLVILVPVIFKNIRIQIEYKILVEMISYGFPVALGNMVNVIFNFTDKYFLNIFSNLKNVGTYSLAYKVSNIVNLLVVNSFINAYMFNYFKNMNTKEGDAYYSRSFTYFYLVISLCSVFVILFFKEILDLFHMQNSEYKESVILIPVLTYGLIFGGLRQMLVLPINKIKKTRIIGILTVFAGILNVILNFLLISRWGALGASYATFIVQFFSCVFLMYYGIKHADLKIEWRRFFFILISFTLIILLNNYIDFGNVFFHILIKISIVIAWIISIYYFGFLYKSEKERIIFFLKKWIKFKSLKDNFKSL